MWDDPLPGPAIDHSESLHVKGLWFARQPLGTYVIEVPTQNRDAIRERLLAQLSLGRDATLAGENIAVTFSRGDASTFRRDTANDVVRISLADDAASGLFEALQASSRELIPLVEGVSMRLA